IGAEQQTGAASTCDDDAVIECSYREGRWFVSETGNCRVLGDGSMESVRRLAQRSESLRTELKSKWLPGSCSEDWKPKCEIVLRSKRPTYAAAVGRGSERTVGSSAVTADKG